MRRSPLVPQRPPGLRRFQALLPPALLLLAAALGSWSLPEGEPPLWDPRQACGTPLLGLPGNAALHPLALAVQPLPAGLREPALHLARLLLAGWGVWLLLRIFSVPRAAALLGAAGVTLSGPLLLLDGATLDAAVLCPFVLYAAERLVRTGRWGLVAPVSAAALLGGGTVPPALTLLLGLLYFSFRVFLQGAGPGLSRGALALRYGGGVAMGILLALPRLLPLVSETGPLPTDRPLAAPDPPGAPGGFHAGALIGFLALLGLRGPGNPLARIRWFLAALAALPLLARAAASFPAHVLGISLLAAAGATRLSSGHARGAEVITAFLLLSILLAAAALPAGLAFLSLAPVLALLARRLRRPLWLAPLPALAAVLAELLWNLPRDPPDGAPPGAGLAAAIRAHPSFREGDRALAPPGLLAPEAAAAAGLGDPRAPGGTALPRYTELLQAVAPGIADGSLWDRPGEAVDPFHPWLRFLGVRWIVTSSRPSPWLARRFLERGVRFIRGVANPAPDADPGAILLPTPFELRVDLDLVPPGAVFAFRPLLAGEAILEVAVRDPAPLRQVFSESLDPRHVPAHRGWLPRRVDLAAFKGKEVTVFLGTGPGPRGHTAFDWAGFADLRIGGLPIDPGEVVRSPTCAAGEAHFITAGTAETEAGPVPLLFMQPYACAEISARVPEEEPELTFRIGMLPDVYDPSLGDGVDFAVSVGLRSAEEVLWSTRSPGGGARVDLGSRAGRETTLVLRARGTGREPVGFRDLLLDGAPPLLEPVLTEGAHVARSHAALPRAFVVHEAEVAAGDEEGLARLRQPGFDPSRRVLLHEPVPGEWLHGTSDRPGGSRARIVEDRRHAVTVETEMEQAGFLVMSDVFHPGWRVEVDGGPARLLRANHAFRAVRLAAGRHTARFRHTSRAWRIGLAAAGATALLLALFAFRARLR